MLGPYAEFPAYGFQCFGNKEGLKAEKEASETTNHLSGCSFEAQGPSLRGNIAVALHLRHEEEEEAPEVDRTDRKEAVVFRRVNGITRQLRGTD